VARGAVGVADAVRAAAADAVRAAAAGADAAKAAVEVADAVRAAVDVADVVRAAAKREDKQTASVAARAGARDRDRLMVGTVESDNSAQRRPCTTTRRQPA